VEEFVRLFRSFLYRDLAFILGGSLVMSSVAWCLPCDFWIFWAQVSKSAGSLSAAFLILLAAMAYVVGYAVQDIGGVVGITFTSHPFNPERIPCWFYCRTGVSWTSIPCWMYRWFTGTRWKPVLYLQQNETPTQFELRIDRLDIPENSLRELERTLSLKSVGMCVGVCSVVSSLILFANWFSRRLCDAVPPVPVLLVISLFLLGVFLVCLGWIKAMQQLQFYQAIHLADYKQK
jgi:hypothetical protein